MANALDALIDRIPDEALRGQIREALKKQNQQKKFGLVFEDHIPESTVLYDVPVKAGSTVALRGGDVSKQMKVLAIDGEVAHCLSLPEREPVDQPLDSLVSVAKFGEPIYPYLKQLDTVCNAPDSDLWHTLIEADNYHALQLLEYLYAEKVTASTSTRLTIQVKMNGNITMLLLIKMISGSIANGFHSLKSA